MQKSHAVSLPDLRSGKAVFEGYPSTEEAIAAAIVTQASAYVCTVRAEQLQRVDHASRENDDVDVPDVDEHYFFPVPGVPQAVLDRVVETFGDVGWPYTEISGGTLVIARTKYVPAKGHPPDAAIVHPAIDPRHMARPLPGNSFA
jgi:hypothetical protein